MLLSRLAYCFHDTRLTNVLGAPPWTFERIFNWIKRPIGEFRLNYTGPEIKAVGSHTNNTGSSPRRICGATGVPSQEDSCHTPVLQDNHAVRSPVSLPIQV